MGQMHLTSHPHPLLERILLAVNKKPSIVLWHDLMRANTINSKSLKRQNTLTVLILKIIMGALFPSMPQGLV